MKALILAAGRGRRMKALTVEKPKALLNIQGKTLLHWSLENLKAAGIDEVGVVTGYKSELLNDFSLSARFHNERWENTNMVYSLFCAGDWLRKNPATILCYSDVLFTAETIRQLVKARGDVVVANNVGWREVWERRFGDPLLDAETFKREDSGRLIEIGNRPRSLDEIQGQYMGLIKVTAEGWLDFEAFQARCNAAVFAKADMTSTLNQMIKDGVRIETVDVHEKWFEFDSEQDLNAFQ